jgi:acyl carrier protein
MRPECKTTSLSIRPVLKKYLRELDVVSNDRAELGDCDSLIARGIIDSTGVMELIAFIEERFKFRVADEELLPSNLDTIANLDEYITRKINDAAH